jgi:hypothetical protein
MNRRSTQFLRQPFSSVSSLLLAFTIAVPLFLITGCGGSSANTPQVGSTVVTVLATSTANDQLSQFKMTVTSLTLADKSGKTVTVFSTPESAEFTHLNGTVEPLYATEIPQDVYTSAAVTLEPNFPVCVGFDSADNDLLINGSVGSYTNPLTPTVNLPAPITVAGAGMGLALNLQMSESISSFNCQSTFGAASITPTFNLTPISVAAQPTNNANGLSTGLRGLIDTVASNGASFTVTAADGPSWQITTNATTEYQGISGPSQLAAGLPVDMDVAIQQDGALLATRVAVYDTNTANLSVMSGPLLEVIPSVTALGILFDQNQGPLFGGELPEGPYNFNFSSATFQTSGQLANLASLPFTPSFTASSMVPGQAVLVTTHATAFSAYIPATTLTLVPQSINGTVGAVSSSGSFTTYSVTLAAYDLFPDLALLPGQPPMLIIPSTVIVYVDSNTQLLNSDPVAVGSLLRFNGLIFNDKGTLRMDCAQISDGVTE